MKGKGKRAGFKSWSQVGSHDFTILGLNKKNKFGFWIIVKDKLLDNLT